MENQTIITIINIIAILLSPLIAVGVGEFLRKRSFEKQKRLDILYYLFAYRDRPSSDEFLQSLNALKLLYLKREDLKTLLNELHSSFLKRDREKTSGEESDELIIKIIKKVCDIEGFKIIEEDIKNLFRKR